MIYMKSPLDRLETVEEELAMVRNELAEYIFDEEHPCELCQKHGFVTTGYEAHREWFLKLPASHRVELATELCAGTSMKVSPR